MSLFHSLIIFMIGLPGILPSGSADVATQIYNDLGYIKPERNIFDLAYHGYIRARQEFPVNNNKPYLTIIDFTLPSSKKRLWVINLNSHKILFNTYVAHGRNSGILYANSFSNRKGSYKSSLGFYLTGNTYYGKNGYSMYLDGLEPNINNKARERTIVMHGAWYVTEKFLKLYGRMGRSFGCPVIPPAVHKQLIDLISDKTLLFVYSHDQNYLMSSRFLQENL